MSKKEELIQLLNKALTMEYAANIQYVTHAEMVFGLYSEPVISQLENNADDETKHAAKVRSLLSDYLLAIPTMVVFERLGAVKVEDILAINLKSEKAAVDIYKSILVKIEEAKIEIPYEYETLKYDVDEILREEQEHIVELERLISK
jgi:bacterioferritin (cytochrome b1)